MKTNLNPKGLRNKILSLLLGIFAFEASAQVTVGSETSPKDGSLLDLKQNDSIGVNSTKGLMLPRVKIIKLNPTSSSDFPQSIQNSGNWDLQAHIGLTVYNVNEDICARPRIYKGMYTWDGTQWRLLTKIQSPNVSKFFDKRDGNTYLSGSFGSAGTWMLQNLNYHDNSMSINQAFDPPVPGAYDNLSTYLYPNGNSSNTIGNPPSTWEAEQGLLYSWTAATNGATIAENLNQGQGDADEATAGIIRGICPEGWHLPSDREWNQLEKEIYNSPKKYSTYTSAELPFVSEYQSIGISYVWRDEWETGNSDPENDPANGILNGWGFRGATPDSNTTPGHSAAMRSPCPPKDGTIATFGRSLTPIEGGFYAEMTGLGFTGNAVFYGIRANFWSSSKNFRSVWERSLIAALLPSSKTRVLRNTLDRTHLLSIRCVKD